MKTLALAFAAILFLISSPLSRAATSVFSDANFDEVGWEEELMVRPPPDGDGNGSGAGTAFREVDPDPDPDDEDDTYRQVSVVRDPDVAGMDVSTRLFSLARAARHDPSTDGAISRVDLSLWGIRLENGTAGTLEPALMQDGRLYVATGQTVPDTAWTRKEFAGLDQADFSEPGLPDSHPDFSNTGGEITFGFAFLVTATTTAEVESTAGFDDWRVVVTHGGIGTGIITAGINDAWFEQATSGQGFFITALPDAGIVFLSWFTYDTQRPPANTTAVIGEPGHRWLTAQGPYAGDTAVLDVYETTGGVFDSVQPVPQTSNPIGTIVITWQDCMHATLDYDLPAHGLEGRIDLVRIAADNVALCVALTEEE
jgi:hypothetical protein